MLRSIERARRSTAFYRNAVRSRAARAGTGEREPRGHKGIADILRSKAGTEGGLLAIPTAIRRIGRRSAEIGMGNAPIKNVPKRRRLARMVGPVFGSIAQHNGWRNRVRGNIDGRCIFTRMVVTPGDVTVRCECAGVCGVSANRGIVTNAAAVILREIRFGIAPIDSFFVRAVTLAVKLQLGRSRENGRVRKIKLQTDKRKRRRPGNRICVRL